MNHPVVYLCLCWLIGTFFVLHFHGLSLAVIVVLTFNICTIFAMHKPVMRVRTAIYFSCFLLSIAYNSVHEWDRHTVLDPSNVNQTEQAYIGRIISKPDIDGDIVQFTLKLLDRKEKVVVRIHLQQQQEQTEVATWIVSDVIKLTGILEQPREATNYGSFDYKKYLQNQRIYWQLRVEGLESIQTLSSSNRWNVYRLLAWINTIRDWLNTKITRIFPESQVGWMKGILIGEKDQVDPERYEQFARLGVTHLLAISGLHVGVLIGAIIWLLRQTTCSRETIFYIICVVIPFYMVLTGAAPSVIRAGIMAVIGCYAWTKGWLKNGLVIWSITLWIMLFVRPDYVHEIGFQLSFAVTAGLIIGVPAFNRVLCQLPNVLQNSLSVTIVSQLVSFPLTVYYFNQFSLLSWLVNLLLVPLVSIIVLPAGLIALLLSIVSESLATVASFPVIWTNRFIFALSEWLDQATFFHISYPSPPPWWIVLYYSLLYYFFYIFQHIPLRTDNTVSYPSLFRNVSHKSLRWRKPCMLFFVFLLLYGYQPHAWSWPAKGLVQFIDVGQGDATLVRSPTGKHLLIDGGGQMFWFSKEEEWRKRLDPFEIGKDVLVPLLRQRGVHQIDYLMLTHADMDHIGGLTEVVQRVPVKQIFINGTVKDSPAMLAFIDTALQKDIPIYSLAYGMKIEVDRYTTLHMIHPFSSETLYNEEEPK